MANYNLVVFKRLCDKAQEMVFDALDTDGTYQLIYVCGLDEELINMTPIEQILYIANNIYCVPNRPVVYEFVPQYEIQINTKKYIADFCILGTADKDFKYPIVIEVDGFEYHNKKAQMNKDYEREFDLQNNGYRVLRFTGSQIFTEPFGCIDKIYEFANKN